MIFVYFLFISKSDSFLVQKHSSLKSPECRCFIKHRIFIIPPFPFPINLIHFFLFCFIHKTIVETSLITLMYCGAIPVKYRYISRGILTGNGRLLPPDRVIFLLHPILLHALQKQVEKWKNCILVVPPTISKQHLAPCTRKLNKPKQLTSNDCSKF